MTSKITPAEYRALRATLSPARDGYPCPLSVAAELRRREQHPPGPAFDLDWDRGYRGDGARYLVTGEGIPAELTVALRVEYDPDGDSIYDEITGAGFQLEDVGSSDPEGADEQERPHHCAVLAQLGGNGRPRYVWIWYDDTEIKAPAGMARGPAEEYRQAEARRYAAAVAKSAEDKANGYRSDYCVTGTVEHDGEELWGDSLGLIDAESEEEAARYYWEQHGSAEAADVIRDWRRTLAVDLARRAADYAQRAAALLS